MTRINDLIPEVLEIARMAGSAIMDVYAGEADFGVEQKPDNTPVTRADRAANRIICDALEALTPDWPIISEENDLPPYDERRNWDYCWIVDPLDGTKEFIRQSGEFCINIALAHRGEAVLGVILAPVSGECFWALKGHGAFELRPGEGDVRLQCASFRWEDEGLRLLTSRSHLNAATEKLVGQFRDPQFIRRGSAVKFGMLARGEADVYPRMGHTGEWDTAAGQIIIEEAGGALLDYQTQKPLLYNKESTENPFFYARGALLPASNPQVENL